ncbi:hypothetical protein PsYK624_059560 [Phanerochaete sordida]|uniref:F-box domain-containing protein n=1 Tax=Phanerochaete sordida TaxID=48140 RepID=A0A9P3LBU6_9APHY|nr:hypothetical protein PsYK624_059560 [Phanerochaete sordida]
MASPKKLQDLPFDVYDYIFDVVRRDDVDTHKRTLFAASQTCKAWAAMTLRARFHTLFLIVKLPGEESIVNFFLQDFAQEPVFARLMQDGCVKSLTLRWSSADTWSEVDFGIILPEYLPLFPGLLALRLRGVLYKRPYQPIAQRFGGVRSLTVDGHSYNYHSWRRHDPRALCDLLCLFPTLQELTLNDVNDWARPYPPTFPADHPVMQGPQAQNTDVQMVLNFHGGLQRALQLFLLPTQGWGNGAFNVGGGGADGSDEEERDGTYDGAPEDLPMIRSVVMEQSDCPPVLASLLQRADVKTVSVTDRYDLNLRMVRACAATVEHVRYTLSYQRVIAMSQPLSVDLSLLHALRSLTLIITFFAGREHGIDVEAPWRNVATVLHAVRRRPRDAPMLDIGLELELPGSLSVARCQHLDENDIVAICRKFVSDLPLTKAIDKDLGQLIDDGKAAMVRVSLAVPACRGCAQKPRTSVNSFLVDAFPVLHRKGHLHLTGGSCTCYGVPFAHLLPAIKKYGVPFAHLLPAIKK